MFTFYTTLLSHANWENFSAGYFYGNILPVLFIKIEIIAFTTWAIYVMFPFAIKNVDVRTGESVQLDKHPRRV